MTKKQRETAKHYEKNRVYTLEEAVGILKNAPKPKFDETVEISFNLALNPKDPSHMVRGSAVLPHGTGKKIRVCVFCKPENETKAKEAGADFAGAEELIKKVKNGWCDFDVAIAETSMMRELAALGRILGPRGLMPNPKAGTVTDDIVKTVKDVKAGRVEFRMDKQGGLHLGVGKISFSREAIIENIKALAASIFASNANLNKPQTVRSIALSTTMGPGLRLDISELRK